MSQPIFVRSAEDLAGLDATSRLAIDTEFHGERRYVPELHLIQMRIDDGPCWILDPHETSVVEEVAPLLIQCTWILHSGRHDLVLLERALGGVADTVLDTQIAAGLLHPRYPAGLARLLDEQLGIRLAKAETLSDWSARPLSAEQLGYAASDVAHLHALWDHLMTQAEERGRVPSVLSACEWEKNQALTPMPLQEAWRSIKGRHSLKAKNVCILRALAAWREGKARSGNQPAHSVLAHGLLLDLSKRAPTDMDALLSSRRAPKTLLRKHGEELLNQIATAPREPTPKTMAPGGAAAAAHKWLQAYAACRGVEHGWGSRLVLPDLLLEDIVAGTPVEEALKGWRWDLIGQDLVETLAGTRRLRPMLPGMTPA